MLEKARQKINLKKRKKNMADKLMEVIRHKLSKYRSPIQKKKEVSENKNYPLRKRKEVNYYEASKKQPKSATLKRKEEVAKTTKQHYINKEKEFNKKFKNKFPTKLQNHKYSTQ